MITSPEALEAVLDYRFGDRQLLARALTHRSIASEKGPAGAGSDNEQLEFLGDAILGFLVSESVLARFPGLAEGELSKLKSRLVSTAHLHRVGLALKIGEYMVLSRGEDISGGRQKRAIVADAVEALLAALYLDGGMDQARRFVAEKVIAEGESVEASLDGALTDAKSALQELAQARKLPVPRYYIVHEDGPDHRKIFTVEVRVGKDLSAAASGESKKAASQKAAATMLTRLQSS